MRGTLTVVKTDEVYREYTYWTLNEDFGRSDREGPRDGVRGGGWWEWWLEVCRRFHKRQLPQWITSLPS